MATSGIQSETPASLTDAAELVREARESNLRVIPVGSGTKRHWVAPPEGPHVELDMRSLNRIVEYAPDDMTVTVEAGITLAALSQVLAERGQRITLDPPHANRATIGGVLAANDSGPIRLAYGPARDIVIGMSMIEPEGTLIRSGGKVVKNVAGYDLHKLYIGSFGTLGPIATVTFRLRPLPETRGLVVLHPQDTADAERMIAATLSGETRPTMVELLNGRMAGALDLDARLTVVIGFEENADAVSWQSERIVAALGGTSLSLDASRSLYERLREAAGGPAPTSFKATMLSSHVSSFVQQADPLPLRIIARAASGIVYGLLDEPLKPSDWQALDESAAAARGHLETRGPMTQALEHRFGRPRPDAHLSQAIQQAFDPDSTFAAPPRPERI